MPIANASLLDEGTAAAEAMILSYNNRSNKKENEQTTFLVSKDCFPSNNRSSKSSSKSNWN